MEFDEKEHPWQTDLGWRLLHLEGHAVRVAIPRSLIYQLPAQICMAVVTLVAVSPAQGQSFSQRDRDFYWYGIGAGIAITICELERNGEVGKGFASKFIKDARANKDITKQPKTLQGLIEASRSSNCRGL
jgi:hypothetical protein